MESDVSSRLEDLLSKFEFSLDEMRAESKATLLSAEKKVNSFSPSINKVERFLSELEGHMDRISSESESKKISIDTFRKHTLLLERIDTSVGSVQEAVLALRKTSEHHSSFFDNISEPVISPSAKNPSLAELHTLKQDISELSKNISNMTSSSEHNRISPLIEHNKKIIVGFFLFGMMAGAAIMGIF